MKGGGKLIASLVTVAVLVGAALTGFATGVRPVLGLDLVGGVSVALQGPANTTKDVMQKALEKIRQRVDALGVAEPDISLLGANTIQVQLPGLGGQGTVVHRGSQWCAIATTGKTLGCFDTEATATARAKQQSIQNVLDIIGRTARLEERQVQQIIPPSTDPKNVYNTTPLTPGDPQNTPIVVYKDTNNNGTFDKGSEPLYRVGPVVITGANLVKATAVFQSASNLTGGGTPGWQVSFTLDKDGSAKFGAITTKLAPLPATDVTKQLAILVDKVVISSPQVVGAITTGTGVITGGFSEAQAKDLAVVLQSGALPVQLKRLNVETVSPTLGKASLRAGLLAGLVGLIALMLYLAFYYRLLGVVTWFGMSIWAVLAIGLVSLLGRTAGYALTLAGVAGIIVSLGITADSYIVFYERLKDEVRHGKTLRAAVQPAFRRSFRTIVAADIVTAIAAGVLYVVSIGSVRGFALTLGLSTMLDVGVVWFFKRPTVFMLARSERFVNMPMFGLRSGVAADDVPTAVVQPVAGGAT